MIIIILNERLICVNVDMVMDCYDTWLCKSNPSVVVSLFLGTGTFKH